MRGFRRLVPPPPGPADRPGTPAPPPSVATRPTPEPQRSGRTPRSERRGLARFIPAPLLHIGRLLIIALIVEYLVVPQIAGSRDALKTLGHVNPLLLLLGVVLEILSLLSYALLTQAVIPPETDPGLFKLFRVELTTLSVSHCVPGGSAAGSSVGYRLLTAAGVRRSDVGFALAAQSLGSAVVLNVIFWIALVVSIPVNGVSPLYFSAALVGALLVGAFIALVLLFSRGEQFAESVLRRITRRLPFVREEAVLSLFFRLAERLDTLVHQRRVLARAVGWATANWLFDAASLFVFVGAFGYWVNPDGLLVAYGLANILAAVPLTPGGLGVIEALLTTTLVAFGTTRAVAILGVVAYRLVNFWLPIPLGGIAYLSLQVDPGASGRSRRDRWRRVRDHAWGAAARGRREHSDPARPGDGVEEEGKVEV
jgi:putative heme transporter